MNFERKREVVDFDSRSGTFRATYDYPLQPPSVAIPLAIAEVTGQDVTEFEPLHESTSVDPEALDELFQIRPTESERETTLTFTYHDYEITVKSHGRIVAQAT